MAWRCPATRCASAAPPPEPPRRNETDQPAVRPANTRRLSGEGRRIPGQRSQPHRRPPSGEMARLAAGGQRPERPALVRPFDAGPPFRRPEGRGGDRRKTEQGREGEKEVRE